MYVCVQSHVNQSSYNNMISDQCMSASSYNSENAFALHANLLITLCTSIYVSVSRAQWSAASA